MSRYFFHIRQGNAVLIDDEGLLLRDVDAAIFEAFQSTKDLTAASIRAGRGLDNSLIEVIDESGHILNPASGHRLLN
jgi:hypothetical protein